MADGAMLAASANLQRPLMLTKANARASATASSLLTANTMRHAQQVEQQAVAAGLRQQLQPGFAMPVQLGGVDQHHGGVGAAGGRDHVAGVLLMARRVADDELAPAVEK
jgi:hypothetical protein